MACRILSVVGSVRQCKDRIRVTPRPYHRLALARVCAGRHGALPGAIAGGHHACRSASLRDWTCDVAMCHHGEALEVLEREQDSATVANQSSRCQQALFPLHLRAVTNQRFVRAEFQRIQDAASSTDSTPPSTGSGTVVARTSWMLKRCSVVRPVS